MIVSLVDFVQRVQQLASIADAYYLFEDECTEEVRELIYKLSDEDTPEPFRSAMYNMGFTAY